MKFKQLHTTLLLSLCAALTACSDEVLDTLNPDKGKTPIVVTAGYSEGNDQSVSTRAVISDGTGKTMNAFEANTSLYMLMKSDHLTNNTSMVTRTIMFAEPQSDNAKKYSDVNYSASNQYNSFVRYWEDSYSRNSALSIVAVCTPGMGAGIDQKAWNISGNNAAYADQKWTSISGGSSSNYSTINWPVGNNVDATDQYTPHKDKKNQDVSFIKNQDLCFSNNIEKHDVPAGYDHRLKFNSNGNRKFDSGTLIFYHALSKFTFLIKMGEGYTSTATDFQFADNKNIALENFYNKGTFNLENGEFNALTDADKNTIQKIYQRALTTEERNEYAYALEALVVPGTDMSTTDNALVIEIAGNEYRISRDKLYNAILNGTTNASYLADNPNKVDPKILEEITQGEGGKKLKAGVHYVFSLTIGKTKIEKISASLVPWNEVVAQEYSPKNTYITLDLKSEGTLLNDETPVFDLYRSTATSSTIDSQFKDWNWETGYTDSDNKAELTKKSDKLYQTKWYWPNNKTFYHLRTVNKGATIKNGTNDYVSIYSGSINNTYTDVAADISSSYNDGKYNDFKWGAPFKQKLNNEEYTITYDHDNNGFCNATNNADGQLYYAIGPTESTINFTQFHVMSNIYVHLTTTNNTDPNYIDLSTIKSVKLYNFAKDAKLYVGNGLVTEYGQYCATGEEMTHSPHVDVSGTYGYEYSFRVVPQSVSAVDNKNKSIVITTQAGNLFTIEDLSQIHITDNNGQYIDPWLPGKSYFYTFKLTKKGVEPIQVTQVDWQNVTAAPENITIK